jgi:hypothetical protein
MWICCGMMDFKGLPRTLFIPPTDSPLWAVSKNAEIRENTPCPLSFRTLWGERTILKFLFKEKKVFMLCHEDTFSCYLKLISWT